MKLYEVINESNWCKDKGAILSNGELTYLQDPKAAKRCLLGWISFHYADPTITIIMIHKVLSNLGLNFGNEVADWNDEENRIVDDVIKLCKDLDI